MGLTSKGHGGANSASRRTVGPIDLPARFVTVEINSGVAAPDEKLTMALLDCLAHQGQALKNAQAERTRPRSTVPGMLLRFG
ncbi:MAG: hypothetical protein EA404_14065 [Spirochaetaceae bacterium]|nr:MAG: hypothetical protein EA404_14065 [Spirochaetaceae bacterium]